MTLTCVSKGVRCVVPCARWASLSGDRPSSAGVMQSERMSEEVPVQRPAVFEAPFGGWFIYCASSENPPFQSSHGTLAAALGLMFIELVDGGKKVIIVFC